MYKEYAVVCVFCFAVMACGGTSSTGATCGSGTMLVNGQCVAGAPGGAAGAGGGGSAGEQVGGHAGISAGAGGASLDAGGSPLIGSLKSAGFVRGA